MIKILVDSRELWTFYMELDNNCWTKSLSVCINHPNCFVRRSDFTHQCTVITEMESSVSSLCGEKWREKYRNPKMLLQTINKVLSSLWGIIQSSFMFLFQEAFVWYSWSWSSFWISMLPYSLLTIHFFLCLYDSKCPSLLLHFCSGFSFLILTEKVMCWK